MISTKLLWSWKILGVRVWMALVIAQVIGPLPPMWETWTVFPAPVFGPGPAEAVAGNQRVNQQKGGCDRVWLPGL